MKKKVLLAIAAIMVMGLGIVAFAYTTAKTSSTTAASCCCSGDSCPMKKKDVAGKETASCCDNCDCCKDGTCPMKKTGDAAVTGMKMTDGSSCPMKNTEAKATADSPEMKNVVFVQGDGCCCSCCKKDKEKKDAPAA